MSDTSRNWIIGIVATFLVILGLWAMVNAARNQGREEGRWEERERITEQYVEERRRADATRDAEYQERFAPTATFVAEYRATRDARR